MGVRQWVLSLPFALRYRLAYDARLISDVLNVFLRALFGDLRRRARHARGLRSTQCGAVTFIQRFGDALNANVHFHSMVLDGVYAAGPDGLPEFHALPAPSDADVLRLTQIVTRRTHALLERRGLGTGTDSKDADPLSSEDPGMAELLARSVRRRIAVGANAGRGVARTGDPVRGSVDVIRKQRHGPHGPRVLDPTSIAYPPVGDLLPQLSAVAAGASL